MKQEKKTLLLIIDNLGRGGAEMMLVDLLPELNNKFEVILVTLTHKNEFKEAEIICKHRYVLGFTNKLSLISCVFKLKRIIKKHQPDLVHAHLIFSSLIARLASPANLPVLYSIHGELSKSDFNNSKLLTFLEKNSLRENHSLLAVSKVVLKDYEQTISRVNQSFVLHNFIANKYLESSFQIKNFKKFEPLKLVAVGNIKSAKNYDYLIRAFRLLEEYPVTLSIYGHTDHPLYAGLQAEIDRDHLKILFLGAIENVPDKLMNYDAFVMSSQNEGFGIAAIEAMACGLPLLLSDIPVMREISQENALFFTLDEPKQLADLIINILHNKFDLKRLSEEGPAIVKNYSKDKYLEKLVSIYQQIMG